MLNWWYIL